MKKLNILLSEIATVLNLATSKEGALKLGQTEFLELDYSSIYGGYRVVNVNINSYAHGGALGCSDTCNRKSLKAMTSFLEGFLAGGKTN